MFTKRFLLFILLLFQLLIKCFSKPIETSVVSINNNVINTQLEDDNWFIRLITNLLGYGLVLVPIALIIFLVKNDLCFKSGIYLYCFHYLLF
jgi:hypothetical protein